VGEMIYLILAICYYNIKAVNNADYCSYIVEKFILDGFCDRDPCCKFDGISCVSNDECSSNLKYDCFNSSCDDKCCEERVYMV
jgi:hypothetical protein